MATIKLPFRAAGFLLGIACLFLVGCAARTPPIRAVYWWKTALDRSPQDSRLLRERGVDQIYLRLFDQDFQGGRELETGPVVVPGSKDRGRIDPSLAVVPVVSVTVADLEFWARRGDPELEAKGLLARIDSKAGAVGGHPAGEVQIDADWSRQTRSATFAVMGPLRRLLHARGPGASLPLRDPAELPPSPAAAVGVPSCRA